MSSMTVCPYCHEAVAPRPDGSNPVIHDNCMNEWYSRAEAGKCVGCGENDLDNETSICRTCLDGGSVPKGYPGP